MQITTNFISTFRLILVIFVALNFLSTPIFSQEKNDFYSPERVAEIRLNFKINDWAEELDSLRTYGDDLLLAQAKIDGKDYKNVGVRYRGMKSFRTGSKRNALHIKLDFIDRSQNHQGSKTIKISNALRDPSMVREVLGFEIARKYMPAPRANFTKVYVNDEYYGMFINVEAVSGSFLTDNFGSDEDTFFECNPELDYQAEKGCKQNIFCNLEHESDFDCYLHNYELRSDHGWDDLVKMTDVLNNSPEKIETVLNVDLALWMLAFNNVLVNLSSYSGDNSENYYLYKGENGMFNTIIWDLNLAFGSYKNVGGGSDLNLAGLQTLDPLLHENNPSKPLISKLLADPMNKMIYLSHVRTILNENFRKGQYLERAKELQRVVNVPLIQDKNRYYESSDFEKSLTATVGSKSKIPGIGELMEKRASFLKKHPALSILPVKVSQVTVESRADMGKSVNEFKITAKIEKFAKRATIMYRFPEENVYRSVVMMDDGKHNDGGAKDNVFGATIKPANGAKELIYYIVAENKGTVTFSPSNYSISPYTSSLDDLNK